MKHVWMALAIGSWFIAQTWHALLTGFSEDDLMNTYFAWVRPWPKLIAANLTPFTTVYRPLGSLFYKVMYGAAGFHPVPFRIAAYALMLLNVWLLYRLIRVVTGSSEMAAVGTVIGAYHKALSGLLVNGGTIYDILCFTFFCLTLTVYFGNKSLTGWRLIGFCALYTLALNSKEMAAGIPAILLVYEVISGDWRQLHRRYAVWIAAAMTVVTFAVRRLSPLFYGHSDYTLNFSVGQYWSTMRPLVSEALTFNWETLNVAAVVCTLAMLWLIALLLRNRALILAASIIMLAPLPINFIPYRGFFVMYIPLIGWAMYFGTALVLLRKWIGERSAEWRIEPRYWLAGAAGVMFAVEGSDAMLHFVNPDPNEPKIERLRKDVARIHAAVPRNGRVLFLSHQFEGDTYIPFYTIRLSYGDPTIIVDDAQGPRPPQPLDERAYDLVVRYRDGGYYEAGSGK